MLSLLAVGYSTGAKTSDSAARADSTLGAASDDARVGTTRADLDFPLGMMPAHRTRCVTRPRQELCQGVAARVQHQSQRLKVWCVQWKLIVRSTEELVADVHPNSGTRAKTVQKRARQ